MKNKKALAGVLLSLSLAGGIVAPASVAFATDETPAAETVAEAPVAEAPVAEAVTPTAPAVAEAPAVEDAPAPATEAAPAEDTSIIVYVEIYQNEKFLFQGIKPVVVERGEDLVTVVRGRSGGLTEEYGLFLRGEVEYLNEGTAIVRLYYTTEPKTTVTTTTEPKTTVTTTTEPKTTVAATPPSSGGKGSGGSVTAEPKKVLPNTGETGSTLGMIGLVLLGFVGLIGATYKREE